MSKKKKLVPRLRFEEFENRATWKKNQLGDMLILLKDGTHGTHQNVESKYFLLSAKNIKNGVIHIDTSEDRTISKKEFDSIHKNFKLMPNDVLLTVVGSIGESAILKNPTNITFQRSVAYLRPNENLIAYFLLSMINSNKFQTELKKRQVVSAQPGIYLNNLSIIPISYPNLIEQKKISSFFRKLNKMIQLQQSKVNKRKDIKSSYLSEMFPKEGEKYPKRRFEGFTKPWIKKKVGEITNSYSGGTPSVGNSKYYTGNIPFIRSGEIYKDQTQLFINEISIQRSSAKMVTKGDILYALYGATSGEVAISKINGAINQAILALIPNSNCNAYFLAQYLNKEKNNILERYLQGGQGNLSGAIVKSIVIKLPEIKEQQKIGEFFKNLDTQIAIEEEKLAKLEHLKQAYLNDMFV